MIVQTVFTPQDGGTILRGSSGQTWAVSSFGIDGTTFGPDFDPSTITDSDRYRALDFTHSFALSTQHDWKTHNFYGGVIQSGEAWRQRGQLSVAMPSVYIPIDMRRPNAPHRLAPLIVESFTGLVFGHGHFPTVDAEGDADTEDFVQALIEAGDLPTVMMRARDCGGGVGTVGLSWRFADGAPRVKVHNGKNLWVHVWKDFDALEPEHVSEIVKVAKDGIDKKTRKPKRCWFWRRRDWTPLADVVFVDQACDEPIEWIVDEAETTIHGEGETHFIWVPNLPDDDEATRIDGKCDFDGQYEPLNTLDVLNSVVTTGAVRNLDPTLVLAVDPMISKMGVRKGSDNALTVGTDGTASYLELSGTSITAGIALLEKEEQKILRVAQCVIPDPAEVAAAGTSSLAIRLLYLPMLGKADLLRAQYGRALVRLLEQMVASARRYMPTVDRETGVAVYPVESSTVTHEDGRVEEIESEIECTLSLPPRVSEEEVIGPDGRPTGKKVSTKHARTPGHAEKLTLIWGEYFPPTEAERQAKGTTLSTATGGKPVMSQRSAAEVWAGYNDLDPATEWQRVQDEQEARARQEAGMFLGTGDEPKPDPVQPAAGEESDGLPRPEELDAHKLAAEQEQADAPPPTQDIQVSAEYVLNGAQISAATAIVVSVVTGELPRDAGLGQLEVLFNLTAEQAMAIMGSAGLPMAGKGAPGAPHEGGAPPGGVGSPDAPTGQGGAAASVGFGG